MVMNIQRFLSAVLALLFLLPGCRRGAAPLPPAPDPAESEETAASPTVAEQTVPSHRRIIVEGKDPVRGLTEAEMEKYPQATNLPTLYIDLGGKHLGTVQHGVYTPGTYTLVENGRGIVEEPLEMKGRGNGSWTFSQKAYSLKLEKAAPLLGMNPGRKWVLITTWSDKTLLRSYLTLHLASELIGMDCAVQTRYADVYVNGKYNGLYLLSQKIALGDGQVEADVLLECEAAYRHSDCSNCVVCPSGCHVMFRESADEEDLTDEERDRIFREAKQLLVEADIAMTTGKGIGVYSRYIDVDSFVDWYIVNEFVKNYDSGFTTSCYCYIRGGRLSMGPCWDYDTCMGNQDIDTCLDPEGYHVYGSKYDPWYSALMEDPDFAEALHVRWTQLVEEGVFEDFVRMIDEQAAVISESEKLDHKKYGNALLYRDLRGDRSITNYKLEVAYLKKWVTRRIEWLNREWNTGVSP